MRLSKALNYFGSMKALADALCINPSTVQAWKKSGLIPAKWEAEVNRLMEQPNLKNSNRSACLLTRLLLDTDPSRPSLRFSR